MHALVYHNGILTVTTDYPMPRPPAGKHWSRFPWQASATPT